MERGLIKDVLALLLSFFSGIPWVITRDHRAAMLTLVQNLTHNTAFDVIHADQLNMAQFAAAVKGGLKVVDLHNALWLLYKRMAETERQGPKKWLFERDWRLLKGYEGKICRDFDRVIAVSEVDKAAIAEVAGAGVDIFVMPIAVDIDETRPVQRAPSANRIVHIGTMFWPPNVDGILWFAREVFQLVKAQKPDVGFDIIGARPPEEVVRLSVEDPGIRVTGFVSDVKDYLEQAGVLIVPVRAGGGMRVKILNQLSQQLPIVTTTIGCEGIMVENGKHVLIADRPQDFARAIIQILDNPSLADSLGKAGRELIAEQYDYRKVCSQLEQVYQA
jgi:glycosyltransferase involved in cell wall biosynthesis